MRTFLSALLHRLPLPAPVLALTRRAGLALILIVAGTPVSYLAHVFLARWLGTGAYGVFAFVMTWAPLLTVLAAFGVPTTALRFLAAYTAREMPERMRGMIEGGRVLVLLGSAAVVAPVALALTLAGAWTPATALGLGLIPLLALLTLYQEMARAFGRLLLAYLPGILRPLFLLGGALVLYRMERLTAETALYVVAGVAAGVLFVQAWAFRRGLPPAVRSAAPAFEVHRWLRNAWPLVLITGFITLANRIDILMLGAYLTPEAVGPYFAASKTTQLVTFVLAAVNIVMAPVFADLHARSDAAGLQRAARTAAHVIFWPTLALFGLLVLFAGPLLNLFGPGFEVARTALVFLALGRLFDAGAGPVGNLMNMTGLQRRGLPAYATGIGLNVALNALCIPRFGLTGAAFATAVSLALVNALLHRLTARHLGVRTSILSALRP